MAASSMESARDEEKSDGNKKQTRRKVYDENDKQLSKKKVSFKERLRRSFRLKRSKSCDADVPGKPVIARSKKRKLSYIFRSFRRNVRKPVKISKELADDDNIENEKPAGDNSNEEIGGVDNTEPTHHAPPAASNDEESGAPTTPINNIPRNDSIPTKDLTRTRNKDENELINYQGSVISTYNIKTRYFLSRLFSLKTQLNKTKNVPQDEKSTMACSLGNNEPHNNETSSYTLQNSQAICNIEQNGYDHFRSSIIFSLNDDMRQKRSSILISLNDKDHPRPSYMIPLNDNMTHSRSSAIFQLGDDMDLSYLIEYANHFDICKFEHSRDIMGGSAGNILEIDNVSPLYNDKTRYESGVCRSQDIFCLPMRESLHLGDEDGVVIVNGPDIL